ncbi:MAG: hypothetical protein ACKO0Z_25360 [Betaproteobacteria bacterium]
MIRSLVDKYKALPLSKKFRLVGWAGGAVLVISFLALAWSVDYVFGTLVTAAFVFTGGMLGHDIARRNEH